jgi:hypothetical protein
MNRRSLPLTILPVLAGLLAAAPAHAATKSCTRDGATLLAASGSTRVVSIPETARNSETRRVRLYGCWTPTGRRFTLFLQRDFGEDLVESAHIEIVRGRYIGVIRTFTGGVSESQTAATWDAQKHTAKQDSEPCDSVDAGDFSGVEDAVFYGNGNLAYACNGSLRIADGQGDREVEPQGADVSQLAISANSRGFTERLYYLKGETPVTLAL